MSMRPLYSRTARTAGLASLTPGSGRPWRCRRHSTAVESRVHLAAARPARHDDGAVPATLYQRLLADRFELLPEPLRTFHASPGGARATGRLRVERGRGRCRNLLASIGKLPPAGESVDVSLAVDVNGEQERWTRSFGDFCLVTRQFERAGRLVELHPPWAMQVRVQPTEDGMRLDVERTSWRGVPLPGLLAPRVDSSVEARRDRWFIDVTIGLPLLGMICRYSGEMRRS